MHPDSCAHFCPTYIRSSPTYPLSLAVSRVTVRAVDVGVPMFPTVFDSRSPSPAGKMLSGTGPQKAGSTGSAPGAGPRPAAPSSAAVVPAQRRDGPAPDPVSLSAALLAPGGTSSLTEAQIQDIVKQNDELRLRLRDFSSALDRALRSASTGGPAAAAKAAGNVRISTSVQDPEVANMQKQMDIVRRERDELRRQAENNPSLARVQELENKLRASQDETKAAKKECDVIKLDLKRAQDALAAVPKRMQELEAREQSNLDTVAGYKEKMKEYQEIGRAHV